MKAAPKPYRVWHSQQGKSSCEVMKISCGTWISFLKLIKWSSLAMKPGFLYLPHGCCFLFYSFLCVADTLQANKGT